MLNLKRNTIMAHQGGDEDGDSDDETGRPAGTLGDLFGLSATNHGLRTWRHPDGSFSVQYCLSVASTMHGDKLWPASQVLACLLGDTEGGATGRGRWPWIGPGTKVLELGSGGALPSFVCLRRGAAVTISDSPEPAEVLDCQREALDANCKEWQQAGADDASIRSRASVIPHGWGEDVSELLGASQKRFDLIIASDCIAFPEFHEILLKSIAAALAPSGVAVIALAFHENFPDEDILAFFTLAAQSHGLVSTRVCTHSWGDLRSGRGSSGDGGSGGVDFCGRLSYHELTRPVHIYEMRWPKEDREKQKTDKADTSTGVGAGTDDGDSPAKHSADTFLCEPCSLL